MMDSESKLSGGKLALDLEWHYKDDDPLRGKFRCGCWYSASSGLCGTFDLSEIRQRFAVAASLGSWEIVGHNINADLKKLVEWGVRLPDDFRIRDSLLAARMFVPSAPTKELKPFAREYGLFWEDKHDTENSRELIEYCAKDTYAAWWLESKLLQNKDEHQKKLYDFQCELSRAFLAVEVAGVKIDRELLEQERLRITTELTGLVKDIPEHIVTNDNVLRAWLRNRYSEKELHTLGTTDTGQLSINVKVLQTLPKPNKEFRAIVRARELQDYLTLYIDRPKELTDSRGFFFPEYKLLVAKTQRRSTTPAIQNWPSEARKVIVSRFPGGKILSLDFKNLEARLFAWQAGCKKLLSALVEGGYPLVAERCFGWERIEKTDPRYKMLKILILAVLYNMSPGMMRYQLKINHGMIVSYEEAEQQLNDFFDVFSEIYDERERRKRFAKKHGYAVSEIGARMPMQSLPDGILPPEKMQRVAKSLENKAVNYPTQNLASYVTGCALVDVQEYLRRESGLSWGEYIADMKVSQAYPNPEKFIGFPIAEVHDELVFDVTAEGAEFLPSMIAGVMTAGRKLKELCPAFDCPIDVDTTVKECWN